MSKSDNWIEQARYDLETAHAMQVSGRYLYVLFCCQQAIEKALKAIIANQSNEFPPRIHTLMRLAEIAQVELSAEQSQLLRELSIYYIQTRYPEEMPALSERIAESQSLDILHQSEETLEWLLSMT